LEGEGRVRGIYFLKKEGFYKPFIVFIIYYRKIKKD